MADEKRMEDVGQGEDALPIKKTSPTVYIVGAVGLVAALGLAISSFGDDDATDAHEKIKASEQAGQAAQGLTKAQLEERKAHLKATQAAFAAAAADEAAEAQKKQMAAPPAEKGASASSAPRKARSPSSRPTAKKKTSSASKKKSMDSLDGFGADIASALK